VQINSQPRCIESCIMPAANKCNYSLEGVPLTELVFTAYDVKSYLREALPALRAAIYRGDLSKAKDVLALHDDTVYDEYELSRVLVENDYSWVFTEAAVDPEALDPEGTLVGLAYPLILAYHRPDIFRMKIGGSELPGLFPFVGSVLSSASAVGDGVTVQPGYREGLRAMWEIVGFLTPESTAALRQYSLESGRDSSQRSVATGRLLKRIANELKSVVDLGYGLVIERE